MRWLPCIALGLAVGLALAGCAEWPLCDEACGDGRRCIDGACVDDPCKDRDCGPDGHGGTCGECSGLCVAGRCRSCPADMVLLEQQLACIDRYEEAWSDALGQYVSLPGLQPAVNITHAQAKTACAAGGKRLCSDSEWIHACTGDQLCLFPYGETQPYGCAYEEGRCFGRPPVDVPPHTGPAPTGSLPGCEGSRPGIFDLVGNVDEWVDTCDYDGKQCTARGGSYDDPLRKGCEAGPSTMLREPDGKTGFRCCKALCTDSPACKP